MGNFIKVTIKKKVSRRKTIKKRINWALVCATKRKIQRLSGESIRFSKPKITIVDDKKKKIMGTRIKGVVPRELNAADAGDIICKARRLI